MPGRRVSCRSQRAFTSSFSHVTNKKADRVRSLQPAAYWQDVDQDGEDQYIRYIEGAQNQDAGQLFMLDICQDHYNFAVAGQGRLKTTTGVGVFSDVVHEAGRDVVVSTADCSATLPTLFLNFVGPRYANDYGVRENECWPSTLVNDPGFALFSDDPWYALNQNRDFLDEVIEGLYERPPGPQYTNGKQNRAGWNRRRRSPDPRVDDLGSKDGNMTHDAVEKHSPAEEPEFASWWEESRAGEAEPAYSTNQLVRCMKRREPRKVRAQATAASPSGEEGAMVTAKAATAGKGIQEVLERSQPTRTSVGG